MNINETVKVGSSPKPTMTIQFPFKIKQVDQDRVEIELSGPSITYLNGDLVKRAYHWLSDEQIDSLIEMLYHKALEQAIRDGVKVA
jgi:hypothetical protein